MTENSREEILKDIRDGYIDVWDNLMIDVLFKEIEKEHEEIQQYRAIGTVEQLNTLQQDYWKLNEMCKEYSAIGTIEEFKALKDCGTHDCIIKHLTGECSYKETGCSDCKSKEMIRTAVERMKPKKVLYRKQNYGTPWLCPNCEADQIKCEFFSEDGSEPQEKHTYCWKCGTVIDWSE